MGLPFTVPWFTSGYCKQGTAGQAVGYVEAGRQATIGLGLPHTLIGGGGGCCFSYDGMKTRRWDTPDASLSPWGLGFLIKVCNCNAAGAKRWVQIKVCMWPLRSTIALCGNHFVECKHRLVVQQEGEPKGGCQAGAVGSCGVPCDAAYLCG
jgi:hypothetical protein